MFSEAGKQRSTNVFLRAGFYLDRQWKTQNLMYNGFSMGSWVRKVSQGQNLKQTNKQKEPQNAKKLGFPWCKLEAAAAYSVKKVIRQLLWKCLRKKPER